MILVRIALHRVLQDRRFALQERWIACHRDPTTMADESKVSSDGNGTAGPVVAMQGGQPAVVVKHSSGAQATVYLHGATVTSWRTADGACGASAGALDSVPKRRRHRVGSMQLGSLRCMNALLLRWRDDIW